MNVEQNFAPVIITIESEEENEIMRMFFSLDEEDFIDTYCLANGYDKDNLTNEQDNLVDEALDTYIEMVDSWEMI